jgi:hypothetical protein
MTCWPPRCAPSRPGCVPSWTGGGRPGTPIPASSAPARPGAGSPRPEWPPPGWATPPPARRWPGWTTCARCWPPGCGSPPAPDWDTHQAWWQSERRIRRKGPAAGTHRPDAEIWWPSIAASPYAGQIWAVEVELTAKHADRTAAIMAGLTAPAGYAHVYYLPGDGPARLTVWDLPPAARTPGT